MPAGDVLRLMSVWRRESIMNTLFMSLVSLSGKTWRKTDLEIQSNHSQSSSVCDAFTFPLHSSYHRSISHLLVYDDATDGISGPYDDDGEPE
jgi:hypothetical protein